MPKYKKSKITHIFLFIKSDQYIFLLANMKDPAIISARKRFLSKGTPSMSTSAVKLTSSGNSHNDNGLDAMIAIQIVGIQIA